MIKRYLFLFCFAFLFFLSITIVKAENATGSASLKFPVTIEGAGTCSNKDECRKLCNNLANKDACTKWYKSQSFYKKPPIEQYKNEILEAVRNKLGCDNVDGCKDACNQEQNKQTCAAIFLAIKSVFVNSPTSPKSPVAQLVTEINNFGKNLENPNNLKTIDPGFDLKGKEYKVGDRTCNDLACVKNACSTPANALQCQNIAQSFGLKSGVQLPKPQGNINCSDVTNFEQCKALKNELLKDCKDNVGCRQYCEKNIELCKKEKEKILNNQNFSPKPSPLQNPQGGTNNRYNYPGQTGTGGNVSTGTNGQYPYKPNPDYQSVPPTGNTSSGGSGNTGNLGGYLMPSPTASGATNTSSGTQSQPTTSGGTTVLPQVQGIKIVAGFFQSIWDFFSPR